MTTESEIARLWSEMPDLAERQAYLREQYRLSGYSDQFIQSLKTEVSRCLRTRLEVGARLAQELLALTTERGNVLHRGLALIAVGNALIEQGNYSQALEVVAEARGCCLQAGAPVEVARTAIVAVQCLDGLGQPEQAISMAAEARPVFIEHQAWEPLMVLEYIVGAVRRRRGRYAESLAALDRARAAMLQTPGAQPTHLIDQARGLVLRYLGRYHEALEAMQAARLITERNGIALSTARCDQGMGMTYYLMGRYQQALLLLDRARRVFVQDAGEGPGVLENELLRADVLMALNRHRQVRDTCARISQLLAERRMPYEAWWSRYLEGVAALHMGDLETAAGLLAEARQGFSGIAAMDRLAEIDLVESELSLARRDPATALMLAEQASVQFQAMGQRIHFARGALLAGRAHEAAEAAGLAEAAYRRALAVANAEQLPWLAYPAHFYLGRLHHSQGAVGEAIADLESALEQIERLRGTVVIEQRSEFLEDKSAPYAVLAQIYLETNQAEKVLYTAERAKSRALVELLAGDVSLSAVGQDAETIALSRRLDDLRATYRDLHRRLILPNSRLEPDRPQPDTNQIQIDLRRCEAEIREMSERLQLRSAGGAVEITAGKVDVVDPRPALQAGEQIVEYFLAGDHFAALVIDARRVILVPLPAIPADIARQLRFLRLNLAWAATGRLPQTPQAMVLLKGLYDELWRPLAEHLLPESRLTVVPHGLLHYLPFHALYDGQAYLLERHELSYLPCSSLLPWCRRTLPEHSGPAVAFGNTLGGRLPQACREAQEIAQSLDGQWWCDQEATQERLQQVAARAGILHLACHGEFRADAPLFSTLYLADGPLTTTDIFNLKVAAQLVTLSACETGSSVIGGGDELIGLSRAWLYAGARTLVSTLWRVSDDASADLMVAFYRALSSGTRRSAALRQAQLAMLAGDKPNWRHPYFWAPFYLTGDNRALSLENSKL